MTEKSKHLLAALITLTAIIVGMTLLGVFSKNRIIVTTLATTGPDYEVVHGQTQINDANARHGRHRRERHNGV